MKQVCKSVTERRRSDTGTDPLVKRYFILLKAAQRYVSGWRFSAQAYFVATGNRCGYDEIAWFNILDRFYGLFYRPVNIKHKD
jgi:hypothetical protein